MINVSIVISRGKTVLIEGLFTATGYDGNVWSHSQRNRVFADIPTFLYTDNNGNAVFSLYMKMGCFSGVCLWGVQRDHLYEVIA